MKIKIAHCLSNGSKINLHSLSIFVAKRMTRYDQETEQKMLLHFEQLLEKDKRHYAAIEATKLGYGGIRYISYLFKTSEYRIRTGIKELNNPELIDGIPKGKQRRPGGGRKKKKPRPLK